MTWISFAEGRGTAHCLQDSELEVFFNIALRTCYGYSFLSLPGNGIIISEASVQLKADRNLVDDQLEEDPLYGSF